MTTGEGQPHLAEIHGAEASRQTILDAGDARVLGREAQGREHPRAEAVTEVCEWFP
ncbi:hypothetical protein [Streptomyces flaveolus]|uniref:hypothetical protein n=1 Tax=Streptomyces flaveolus TaxID=67297 RepID=UPI003F4E3A91